MAVPFPRALGILEKSRSEFFSVELPRCYFSYSWPGGGQPLHSYLNMQFIAEFHVSTDTLTPAGV